jgi:iron complex transport system permease protein
MAPQNAHTKTSKGLITAICISLLLLFIGSLGVGSVYISLTELYQILLGQGQNPAHDTIFWEARLPRSITAVSAGAALALSGLLMQTLFRNPLAGPSVLGISGGSSLMVALLLLSSNALGIHLSGFSFSLVLASAAGFGAIAILLLILVISQKFKEQYSLLLTGIMLGYLMGALENILQFQSSSEALKSYIVWGMGSFGHSNLLAIGIISSCMIAGGLFAWIFRHSLNVFLMGDQQAQLLGLSVKKFRIQIILITGMLVAAVTAFCGPVGFIGLVSPHLVRMALRESDHQRILIATILTGSLLALISDMISRLSDVPLNAITSLIGAPVVLWVIFNQRKS